MADRPPLTMADGRPIPEGPGVYLLHGVDPATGTSARYRHAGHYTGVAEFDLESRIRTELAGTADAANLVKVFHAAGLGFIVDQVWPGKGRDFERRLKNRGGAAQYCQRCRTEHPTARGRRSEHRTPPRQGENPTPPAANGLPAPRRAVRAFLRLNPAFQLPARAPWPVQYARVRGREEDAVLGTRVRLALREEDNHPLSQYRAAAVINRARDAHRPDANARSRQRLDPSAPPDLPPFPLVRALLRALAGRPCPLALAPAWR